MKNKKLIREVKEMTYSVVRLLPSFLILAIGAALFGYGVLGIHDDRLGVGITVPLVAAFGLSRVLVLSLPREPKKQVSIVAPSKFIGVAAIITAAIIMLCVGSSAILLTSAAIYRTIGMPNAAIKALVWSGYDMGTCLFVFVFMTVLVMLSSLYVVEWFVSLCGRVANLLWEVLCTPTRIARFLGEGSHLSPSH